MSDTNKKSKNKSSVVHCHKLKTVQDLMNITIILETFLKLFLSISLEAPTTQTESISSPALSLTVSTLLEYERCPLTQVSECTAPVVTAYQSTNQIEWFPFLSSNGLSPCSQKHIQPEVTRAQQSQTEHTETHWNTSRQLIALQETERDERRKVGRRQAETMRVPVSKLRVPKDRFKKAPCFMESSQYLHCLSRQVADSAKNTSASTAVPAPFHCNDKLKALSQCLAAYKGNKGALRTGGASTMNYHIQRLAKKSKK